MHTFFPFSDKKSQIFLGNSLTILKKGLNSYPSFVQKDDKGKFPGLLPVAIEIQAGIVIGGSELLNLP